MMMLWGLSPKGLGMKHQMCREALGPLSACISPNVCYFWSFSLKGSVRCGSGGGIPFWTPSGLTPSVSWRARASRGSPAPLLDVGLTGSEPMVLGWGPHSHLEDVPHPATGKALKETAVTLPGAPLEQPARSSCLARLHATNLCF